MLISGVNAKLEISSWWVAPKDGSVGNWYLSSSADIYYDWYIVSYHASSTIKGADTYLSPTYRKGTVDPTSS
jgi:hypothetical protein